MIDVKLIRIVTGEEIIAELLEETESYIKCRMDYLSWSHKDPVCSMGNYYVGNGLLSDSREISFIL